MYRTSIESHFVINLDVMRHPQIAPDLAKRPVDGVSSCTEQQLCSTSVRTEIGNIQAVESVDAVIAHDGS